jgi:histidine triad (HIT) family protein
MDDLASCKFCPIASRALPSYVVFEDDISLAFLDARPLFLGHTLLIPKQHHETLSDLPEEMVGPFFGNVRLLARAVEQGMQAEGTFVAINNRVSQSIPHLHVHIVPRRKKDGLRGFFWPRQSPDADAMQGAQDAIRRAIGIPGAALG